VAEVGQLPVYPAERVRSTPDPLPIDVGGVSGSLPPNDYAARDHSVSQTYDITLVGRRVTVVNGKGSSDEVIPWITVAKSAQTRPYQ
jgi:hypothetical protein